MKRTWTLGLAAAVAMALLAWGLVGAHAAAQHAPGAGPGAYEPPQAAPSAVPAVCGQMNTVPSPNVGGSSYLTGVAALASNDVWAVGYYAGSALQTLTEHWNGTAWSVVPSPNVGTHNNLLTGVSAVASNDVWAVGNYYNGNAQRTLAEHWNGTAWAVVASPNPGPYDNVLTGVSALASNNVWAVGLYVDSNLGVYQTLVEHWNGTAWSVMPGANYGTGDNVLNSVSARANNDIWAVGYSGRFDVYQTLVEHWNGSAWSVVSSPSPDASNKLNAVAALASNDVWAVGGDHNSGSASQTLVEHWNGSAWAVTSSPNPGSGDNVLYGVAAPASNDVWAVGSAYNAPTLVEHWNGTAWAAVTNANSGGDLFGVSALPGGDVWVVGSRGGMTLVEKYGGACGAPTPTPAMSPTPVASPTPAASPTPCGGGFSDVHPSDYFYTPVSYLAGHGVISGYADCTFRPYANTTRSQMVKIVVIGFAKPITTPGGSNYSFTDVPRSQPFFAVVETAYADGIVSGYACGAAPAGPCDAAHRPYFLPYANVTRSQLSKIAVIAAGWTLANPVAAPFTDVPPGSPFYQVIATAVCHGVISGYADHTFHPFADATRGQIAKIVYLALVNPPVSCGP